MVWCRSRRLHDIPLPLLIQQLMAPVMMHMLVRPAMPQIPGIEVPNLDTVCDTFTETFLRAAGVAKVSPRRRKVM